VADDEDGRVGVDRGRHLRDPASNRLNPHLLGPRRSRSVPAALLDAGLAALCALTGVISALTTWNDVRYTAMSVVVVVFVVHRDRVLSVASATVILTGCSNEKTARP
jgi:hypothetical protein